MDDAKAKGTKFINLGPEYVELWEDFKKSDVQTVIVTALAELST